MKTKNYYEFPNKRITVLAGISPRRPKKTFAESLWTFEPTIDCELQRRSKAMPLDELAKEIILEVKEKGLELPPTFMELVDFTEPRITTSAGRIKFKCQYADNGRVTTSVLGFQHSGSIASFSMAMESALSAKKMWKTLYKEVQSA